MRLMLRVMLHKLTLLALLFVSMAAAQAHDFHAGITDISYNERTGNTEVVHTFMTHDIEALFAAMAKPSMDISKPEGERLLRTYIEARFSIEDAAKRPLTLQWVGIHADTQSVTIYQELSATVVGPRNVIQNGVLSDFYPDQRNTVNLRHKGQTKSLLFDKSLVRQIVR